jgi:acetyl esterase
MRGGKYEHLIDPDLWAYIDEVNRRYPPEVVDLPIAEQRAIYNAMCADFHSGRPDGVKVRDSAIDLTDRRIPLRIYHSADESPPAKVVYLHGGGFVLGGLDSHDDICADLCAGTGYDVISVDYRLAPEHVHPSAFDDARAAFAWTAASTTLPIVLCGESAGGNLAAAVAHATRGDPSRAAGQVLVYPMLGRGEETASSVRHADAPLLSARDLDFYRQLRTGGAYAAGDATMDPLSDKDFAGLPPTVIATAEYDPLGSDGFRYRDKIVAAGGLAWCHEEPRLVHSFLRARRSVPRAQDAFAGIVAAVVSLGRGAWAY